MKVKTLLSSVIIITSGVFGDPTFAQSIPQQTGSFSVISATHSGRVRNPESLKKAKLTRLKKDVALDEQQVQSAMPIIESYVTAVQNVKKDATLDSRTRRLKLSELRNRYDSDIDALLTPEQQQKLASIKAERRSKLRGARPASESPQSQVPDASAASAVVQ
jgi:hypothetical protein